MTENSSSILLS